MCPVPLRWRIKAASSAGLHMIARRHQCDPPVHSRHLPVLKLDREEPSCELSSQSFRSGSEGASVSSGGRRKSLAHPRCANITIPDDRLDCCSGIPTFRKTSDDFVCDFSRTAGVHALLHPVACHRATGQEPGIISLPDSNQVDDIDGRSGTIRSKNQVPPRRKRQKMCKAKK